MGTRETIKDDESMSTWIRKNTLSWYHRFCINVLKAGPIPSHVAFIMDGNRRYARKANCATSMGHSKGFDKLSETLLWCRELGIKEVTVYAFSIENFARNDDEVETLMTIATKQFAKLLEEIDQFYENGWCIRVIGNLSLLSDVLKALISSAMLLTKDNNGAFLNIAFAYTSQDEIANAFDTIRHGVREGEIGVNDIDEDLISRCMYTGKSSEPDILIRTSGEVRFSDFLLWQSWNTNVMFQKVLWPEFSIWHMLACVFHYQMHYADQKRVRSQLKAECKSLDNPKVHTFVKNLDRKRTKQLKTYAALLPENVTN